MSTSSPPAVRSLLPPLVATLIALAILIALGTWQLQRKAWKEDLLRQIETRAHATAGEIVPESRWLAWRAAEDEFRRVRLDGTSRPDQMVAVGGLAELRPRQATQGFYFFVPLVLPDGAVVFVNRGFAPTELRREAEAALRAAPPTASVTGLVRAPETRGLFVPENVAARDSWWVRNLDDMARARGLARVAPFYIDAVAGEMPGEWPKGGQTQLALRNNHLQYAVTWFGLACTLVGVFGVFAWKRMTGRD